MAKTNARRLTTPERHQLKVARDTLKMSDAMAGVMGGPSKAEARRIHRRADRQEAPPPPTAPLPTTQREDVIGKAPGQDCGHHVRSHRAIIP